MWLSVQLILHQFVSTAWWFDDWHHSDVTHTTVLREIFLDLRKRVSSSQWPFTVRIYRGEKNAFRVKVELPAFHTSGWWSCVWLQCALTTLIKQVLVCAQCAFLATRCYHIKRTVPLKVQSRDNISTRWTRAMSDARNSLVNLIITVLRKLNFFVYALWDWHVKDSILV